MGKIGIVGYGNLGQGVECALRQSPDLELAAVFTRRDLQIRSAGIPALPIEDAYLWQDRIDVMILCGGSGMLGGMLS
jgi:diaminopimelate dehydrogenase